MPAIPQFGKHRKKLKHQPDHIARLGLNNKQINDFFALKERKGNPLISRKHFHSAIGVMPDLSLNSISPRPSTTRLKERPPYTCCGMCTSMLAPTHKCACTYKIYVILQNYV